MKPFLGIDLTDNKNNEEANGAEFLVQEISEQTKEELYSSMDAAMDLEEKSDVPKVWRIIRFVFGLLAAMAIVGLARGKMQVPDLTVAQMYHNAPWVFWGGGICLVIWMVLRIVGDKKQDVVSGSPEGIASAQLLTDAKNKAMAELQIPDTALDIDVLSFYYKVKDGEVKLAEKTMQLFSHINVSYKAYADNHSVYFADTNGKYAFALTSLKGIRAVNKQARLSQWNKTESFQNEKYKPYKLTADQFGSVHVKPYYSLEIEMDNETWELYFPCYELPQIEALTGLHAE